ncbi:MAG: hypothetical protein SH808_15195 [Saprospiraceae bacterium]|nr:hypothetical protein [Saprospiraceae bacterium]
MAELSTIVKNKPRPLSQDYDRLRVLGLKYIEQFSKDIWTDYNVHDPGITTLEVLNYVLTDLAYRTAMPVEDILARKGSDLTKDFFTAREILPVNPVTFDDLRKKIIDIAGVENAWVLPYMDDDCADPIHYPAYFIKCNSTPKSIDLHAEPQDGYEARNINGLYYFNLLLEEDAVLGDLNILSVDWEMRDNVSGKRKALVRFTFPLLMEKTYPGKAGVTTDIEQLANSTIAGYTISNFDTANNTFELLINPGPQQISILEVAFHLQIVHTGDSLATLKNDLELELLAGNTVLFSILPDKVKKISGIIDEVYCMYQRVRNLCEDVIRIGVVPSQEIAVCADIETDAGVDLEEILGYIYFAVDTFFSPPVRFYLLKEMLNAGYSTAEIFEGPLLKHGFLRDEDLRQKSLFDEVHVSDLYHLIMQIPGVRTIQYLQVTNYHHGIPQTAGEFWKLILGGFFHLNLDRLRSKIKFYKGIAPAGTDKQVADRIYHDLKATLSKPRLDPDLKTLNDLLPPSGTHYNLEEYYSLQNEFPFTYGVNRDGIPSGADIIRKTKIKQLKGYLLFFDQLLANYLSQLAQLKNLYARDTISHQTYFTQPVYDVPIPDATETAQLYSINPPPAPVMPDPETLNFYDTAPLLKDFATQTLVDSVDIDDRAAYENVWKVFANQKNNAYRDTLAELAEPADDKLDRRNRFLDHLLARFAESFSSYAAMMYKLTGNIMESSNQKTAEAIVDSKSDFLQDYHILSYNRGKGQFYKCCPAGNCNIPPVLPNPLSIDDVLQYDTHAIPLPSNGTGLHKRASRLLGMRIDDNSDMVTGKFTVIPSGLKFKFQISYDSPHVLTAVDEYDTVEAAFAAMEKIVTFLMDEDDPDTDNIYFEAKAAPGGFRIEVKETPTALTLYAVSSPVYVTLQEAQEKIASLREVLLDEGMHIIEHLLLRPLPASLNITANDLTNGFFPLCAALNPDCDCPVTDYYSFRISVVLPYWTPRFRNMDFRAFTEDTIHRETPAHILPKFCWISMYDMHQLETVYTDWFTENKKYKPAMNVLSPKLVELIKTLNTITNVYPEGHLHDCENPSTDNPVILDQTILGTF